MQELERVQQLGDHALLEALTLAAKQDRQLTVRLLAELGEVHARGLFRALGFSTMFDYATRKLGMSEAEAALRLRAAKLGRAFPIALEMRRDVRFVKGRMASEAPDYDRTASELLRALRGGRSQEAFARRLGCRSHAIYTWESGRNYPTAGRTFLAAARIGVDVSAALRRFYRRPPAWLSTADFSSPVSVARLLDDLRGKTTLAAIARTTGRTRFAVARWLKGQAQPRLPDFLRLIEATSLRLLDFVACLVDPEQMPSIAPAYRDLEATRRAAYELPWSHAFLRALEMQTYKALPVHQPGWLADTLALDRAEEQRSLALLEQSGQITLHEGRYVPTRVTTVDTRRDVQAARRLHHFFSMAGAQRLQEAPEGTAASAYNLFGVSRVDLERLRELQRTYFREMRAIIADSEPVEAVVLANMQMIELSSGRSTDG